MDFDFRVHGLKIKLVSFPLCSILFSLSTPNFADGGLLKFRNHQVGKLNP